MSDIKNLIRRKGIMKDEDVKLLTSYYSNKAKTQYHTMLNKNGRPDINAIARRMINNEDLNTVLRLIKSESKKFEI
jgi:hypothetical protein